METYIYSIKCMACGLHYNVYSWDGDWSHEPYCPECGRQSSLILKTEKTDQPIFTYVNAGTGVTND